MEKITIKARLEAWFARRPRQSAAEWICSEFVGLPGIVKAELADKTAEIDQLEQEDDEIDP